MPQRRHAFDVAEVFFLFAVGCWSVKVYVATDQFVAVMLTGRAMSGDILDTKNDPRTRADEVRWSRLEEACFILVTKRGHRLC